MSLLETILRKLDLNTWYPISALPRTIGIPGIFEAHREQILKPDYEIVIGRYYATFKIIRAKTETLKIINRIEKAM